MSRSVCVSMSAGKFASPNLLVRKRESQQRVPPRREFADRHLFSLAISASGHCLMFTSFSIVYELCLSMYIHVDMVTKKKISDQDY